MKHFSLASFMAAFLFTILFATPLVISTEAEAKGFRSSSSSFSRSSFSSSSKSKPSFSSYKSKPAVKKPATASKPKAVSTTNKTAQSSKVAAKKPASSRSVATPVTGKKAKQALTAQRAQFKKPTTVGSTKVDKNNTRSTYNKRYSSNPVYSRGSSYDRRTYYSRRNNYYSGYNAPNYVYYGSPSYGMWDTLFLYAMLSNMNNASSFGYNHHNDPGYKSWRAEANAQAQTNAELKAQLAAMDAKVNGMSGKRDPGYLPPGTDADIALAAEALEAQKPVMKVCTGAKNGAYYRVASNVLTKQVDNAIVVPVSTEGSRENLQKLAAGDCDAAIVQGDSYWNYVEQNETIDLPFERVTSLMNEAVHLICNADGPTDVEELTASSIVLFPSGSGAAETWTNLIAEDEAYEKVRTPLTDNTLVVKNYEQAIMKVKDNSNTCAMFVGVAGATNLMSNFEKIAVDQNLVMIDVEDSDIVNTTDPSGKRVYSAVEVDDTVYPNLLRQNSCYGYCSGDNDTIQLSADIIVSNKWKAKNAGYYDQVAVELMGSKPSIDKSITAARK